MSFNNAIPADLLLAIARAEGAYFQLSLPLYVARWNIDEQYLIAVPEAYGWVNEDGGDGSTLGHIDHPSFAALRNALERGGYIKTQRNWSNGDRVTKEFYLNDRHFEVGDGFPCATAQRNARKEGEIIDE